MAVIDKWFEATKDSQLVVFGIFDRRARLHLNQVAFAVSQWAGREVPVDELRSLAAKRWFRLEEVGAGAEAQSLTPVYSVERIELFLELSARGWKDAELAYFAECEESFVDEFLTFDDLAYEDDDLKLLSRYLGDRVKDSFDGLRGESDEQTARLRAEASSNQAIERRALKRVHLLQQKGVVTVPEMFRHMAFRIRALEESMRVHFVQEHRALLKAGYSWGVVFDEMSWRPDTGFGWSRLNWPRTLESPWLSDSDGLRVRLPGVLLHDDRVTLLQPATPQQYRDLWSRHDLEGYFQALAELRKERRCGHCLVALTEGPSSKRYCSEKCRHAARQKRHREKNPEAVERAQQRYWSSVGDE